MKKLIFGFLLIYGLISQAQELNYGIALGGNLYEIYSDSALNPANSPIGDEAGTKKLKFYIGGYLDYGFTENLGGKLFLGYNQKTLKVGGDVNFSFIDISPSFKYSFGDNYSDGFYLLLGPRFSYLSSADFESQDVKGSFENTNIGIQLGVGTPIYQFLELELRVDYGLTALYDVFRNDRKIFGGIIALNLNLGKIIKK